MYSPMHEISTDARVRDNMLKARHERDNFMRAGLGIVLRTAAPVAALSVFGIALAS